MINRRRFLQGAAGGFAAAVGGRLLGPLGPESALAAGNVIAQENLKAGTETFRLTKYNGGAFGGYCEATSVNLGAGVPLRLGNFGPPTTAQLDVYRLGYYGGAGATLVGTIPAAPAGSAVSTPLDKFGYQRADHSDPNWWKRTVLPAATYAAVTGVYLVKMTVAGQQTHFPYIVRDDARARDLLVVMPTNSWQAYNTWFGHSFYFQDSYGPTATADNPPIPLVSGVSSGHARAVKVSFDRAHDNVYNRFDWVLRAEFPLIHWLERQGYDLAYTSDDIGLHAPPSGQLTKPKTKTLVIAGHSEYWTQEMRANVEAARDAGVNVASFSANTGYWKVRYEDSARTMVCFKTVEGTVATGRTGVNDYGPGAQSPGTPTDSRGPDLLGGTTDDLKNNATTTFRDPGFAYNAADPNGDKPTSDGTPNGTLIGRVASPTTPESALFGVLYVGDDDPLSYPLNVPPDNGGGEFGGHRAWRHTDVACSGRSVGHDIVGWEWDAVPSSGSALYARAAGVEPGGVKRLAMTNPQSAPTYPPNQPSGRSYLQDPGRRRDVAPPAGQGPEVHAITYRAASGALVFASGTSQWSFGLAPHYFDTLYTDVSTNPPTRGDYLAARVDASEPAIQQATYNILADGGVAPTTPSGITLDSGSPQGSAAPVCSTPPPPPPPPAPTPAPKPPPKKKRKSPRIAGVRYRASSRGIVQLAVINESDLAQARWTGPLMLKSTQALVTNPHRPKRKRRVAFGSRRVAVPPMRTALVEFKLSRSQLKMLERLVRITVMATFEARDDSGVRVTVKQKLTLLRPPRRRARR